MQTGSLVPPCESKGLNSDHHQSWQQAFYPLITSFYLFSLVHITSLILFYVWCFVCKYLYTVCVPGAQEGQKRVLSHLGLEVQTPCENWKSCLTSLKEQQVLLNTELALHPLGVS